MFSLSLTETLSRV